MIDPLFMHLLRHQLGSKYIVQDKSANIHFLLPGRNTVYADIHLDAAEIIHIKELSANYIPVHRQYTVNIFDDAGIGIAAVEKTVYIRRNNQNPPLDNKKALVDQALLFKCLR